MVKAEWPWKYWSRSKVITCDTPSDANDDLCQIWKECKQNCRFFFKVKAEKLEKFAKNWNFIILLKTLHATHPLIVVIICGNYGNNRSRTDNVTEWTWFSKSRSNEDIGQGQRSSHATHLLMLVIICIKYGKNPSRTVDATEWTRFSRPRPNDLEDIGQGQRSIYATHPLILVIICAKYGKNPSRTVVFFKVKAKKFKKFDKNSNFQILNKT